jgi:acyl-CoA dehydrogenase
MALVLNEEQQLLKESAKAFLTDKAPVAAIRKLRDERDETGYDPDLWHEMAEMGFAGVLIEEEYGGSGFGYVGAGVIMEEMGRTLAASPMLATAVLGVSALNSAGTREQKSEILPKIANGELTIALAVDESPRHRPANTALKVERESGDFVLNGRKTFVLDGHSADKLIVSARTSGEAGDETGITLFLLDRQADGISVERTVMVDSRNAATINFESVRVGNAEVLGGVDEGFAVLQSVLDAGCICLAAEMSGLSQETFERTVTYLQERKQFGELIGTFQSLQHRAAHLFCEIENGKSVVLSALQALDDGDEKASLLASLAKAKLGKVAKLAGNEGVQMHGGIGMTDEFEIGFFMKRARAAMATFGDIGYHSDRFASLSGY